MINTIFSVPQQRDLADVLASAMKWRKQEDRYHLLQAIGILNPIQVNLDDAPNTSALRVVEQLAERGSHSLIEFMLRLFEVLQLGEDAPIVIKTYAIFDNVRNLYIQHPEIGQTLDNSKDTAWFQQGVEIAHSVAQVRYKTQRYGTGFLVGSDLLMTCHHVIPNEDEARNCIFLFGRTASLQGVPTTPQIIYPASSDAYIYGDPKLDVAIIRLAQSSGWPPLRHNNYPEPKEKDRLNIIHFPEGMEQQIAFRGNRVNAIKPPSIRYSTGTKPGSSGAPVFNDNWELVALHTNGGIDVTFMQANNEGILLKRVLESLPARVKDLIEGDGTTVVEVE
jgi:V8-like Glu-specific endopeptidase